MQSDVGVGRVKSENDFSLVSDLQGEVWSQRFFEGMVPFNPMEFANERKRYWIDTVRPALPFGHLVLIARVASVPCGYCHFAEIASPAADLSLFMPRVIEVIGDPSPVAVEYLALGVLSRARGRGVGRSLLVSSAEGRTGPFGLWVADQNTVARRFYQDLGWKEEKTWRRLEGGVEEVRMSWGGP